MCMSSEQNLHSGHRERMMEKFLINKAALSDHEVLEMLLFYALPRINTNDIAHRLINTFGSLNNVFAADKDQLKAVKGVGEKAALQIMIVGDIINRLHVKNSKEIRLNNFSALKEYLDGQFDNKVERFLIILLDKKYKVIAQHDYTDNRKEVVSAEIPEFASLLAAHKAENVMLIHNHPSGDSKPSESDDTTTAQVAMICSMHGKRLVDHVIFGDNLYSYRDSGKLQKILNKANINNITY